MGHPAGTTEGNSFSIIILLRAIWSELSDMCKGHEVEAKGSWGKTEELWLYLENVFLAATELS